MGLGFRVEGFCKQSADSPSESDAWILGQPKKAHTYEFIRGSTISTFSVYATGPSIDRAL